MRTGTVTVVALLSIAAWSQSTPRPKFFDHALIQHNGSEVTVAAYESLPLRQMIFDLRLEYGWQINWEQAPGYSRFDVVDDTSPKWRAAHPDAKGVTRPSGGLFTATFPEPKEVSSRDDERDILDRLIKQYNETNHPGKYVLRVDGGGKLTVIGTIVSDETCTLQEVKPLLDTAISLAKVPRNVSDTIASILTALEASTGKKVLIADFSQSLFRISKVAVGGERTPARELLMQALAGTNQLLEYDLTFNPDVPVYVLSTSPVVKQVNDPIVGKRLIYVHPLAKP